MKKIFNIILLASILIVPLASVFPIIGTITWYPQLLALMVLGFLLLASLLWEMNPFISLFLMYAVFSYLVICSQTPRAMLCLITGFSGVIFSYFISKNIKPSFYKAICVVAVINIGLVILQVFNLDPIFKAQSHWILDRTVGFMGSRNQLALFCLASSLVGMVVSPWFILLSWPIFLVKCSSAMLGLLVGIISYLFMNNRKDIINFILLSGICVIFIFCHDKSNELKERMSVWNLSIHQTINGTIDDYDSQEGRVVLSNHRVVKCNPWTGFGLGNFFVFSPSSQVGFSFSPWHRFEHAHNDMIESFFEFGKVGLGLLVLCILGVINDFRKATKTREIKILFSSLIALGISSCGVYAFHAPVSFFMVCLVLGLFYGEIANAKQSKIA